MVTTTSATIVYFDCYPEMELFSVRCVLCVIMTFESVCELKRVYLSYAVVLFILSKTQNLIKWNLCNQKRDHTIAKQHKHIYIYECNMNCCLWLLRLAARCIRKLWWKARASEISKICQKHNENPSVGQIKNMFYEFKRNTIIRATCVSVSTKHMRRGKRKNWCLFCYPRRVDEWIKKYASQLPAEWEMNNNTVAAVVVAVVYDTILFILRN